MCGFFLTNDPFCNIGIDSVLSKRLDFRGPDYQSGIVKFKQWHLYHARLSIIATSTEFVQPYFTEGGGCLVFNGEILNYEELARKYGFESRGSDTHVLSSLLEYGSFDLSELEGFFAFAFINREGKLLSCARDRFGVKPLFFCERGQYIAISSEASVLSDLYDLPYDVDALEEYKAFRAPIFKPSFFNGVNNVAPGHCLVKGCYFDTLDHVVDVYTPFDIGIKSLERAIQAGIKSRLISDVPVALLFSGGIDSNLIASYLTSEVEKYTGGVGLGYDLDFARKTKGVNVIDVGPDTFKKRFYSMVELRKEPLSVPNEVVLSILAEHWAKRGGKVLISGECADELFAGYDRIFGWALKEEVFEIEAFLSLYAYVPVHEIGYGIRANAEAFFDSLGDLSVFEKVRQFFLKKHLPILFRRLDFALMFSGVEGREPLAFSKVFETAMAFSPSDLFLDNLGKKPLRELASKTMGEGFAYREKVGFPVDVKSIFVGAESANRVDNYTTWIQVNLGAIA